MPPSKLPRINPSARKRATVVFNLPGDSQTIVQENPDVVDEDLRKAIRAAKKTFMRLYAKVK